jgi:hypothetical protein
MTTKKVLAGAIVATCGMLALAGCTQAQTASNNLSKDADSFKIQRDIVFYNGITDKYILEIKGLCSVDVTTVADQAAVTCKIGDDKYIKDFIGLSDNVTYVVNQTQPSKTDPYAYKIVVKPTAPDFDVQVSH